MNKILSLMALCAGIAGLTSCSDVELPEAANRNATPVKEVVYTLDGRNVTLTWDAVPGAVKYYVYQGVGAKPDTTYVNSYQKKIGYGDNKFIVKSVDANNLVSEGKTISFYLPAPEKPEGGSCMVGYLLTANSIDELPIEEKIAADWFKTTYVDTKKGKFLTATDLSVITPTDYAAIWVHFERIGIEAGYDKLPLTKETISDLKTYAEDGGNLYLTKHATQLAFGIGRTQFAPGIFKSEAGAVGGDIWYANATIGSGCDIVYDRNNHPIFMGLEKDENVYATHVAYPLIGMTYRTDNNCMWDLNACGFPGSPNVVKNYEDTENATVLATWGQVTDYCCAGIVEFNPSGAFTGKTIANGLAAYQFTEDNAYTKNVLKMTKNALDYLRGEMEKRAAYLVIGESIDELPEAEQIAAQLFKENYVNEGLGYFVNVAGLASLSTETTSCLWIHIDRLGLDPGFDKLPLSADNLSAISAFVEEGGNLYLTKHATQIANGIKRTEFAPGIFNSAPGAIGGDIWTINAMIGCKEGLDLYDHRDHPIFKGLSEATDMYQDGHAAYYMIGTTYRTDHNCMWDLNACGFPGTPNVTKNFEDAENATVLATWGQVDDYCCAGLVEFDAKGMFLGKIVANGLAAYQFTSDNQYADNVNKLTLNAIEYLR